MGGHAGFLSLKARDLCGGCSGDSLLLVCTGEHPQGKPQPCLLMQQFFPSAPSVPFVCRLVALREVASELWNLLCHQ